MSPLEITEYAAPRTLDVPGLIRGQYDAETSVDGVTWYRLKRRGGRDPDHESWHAGVGCGVIAHATDYGDDLRPWWPFQGWQGGASFGGTNTRYPGRDEAIIGATEAMRVRAREVARERAKAWSDAAALVKRLEAEVRP